MYRNLDFGYTVFWFNEGRSRTKCIRSIWTDIIKRNFLTNFYTLSCQHCLIIRKCAHHLQHSSRQSWQHQITSKCQRNVHGDILGSKYIVWPCNLAITPHDSLLLILDFGNWFLQKGVWLPDSSIHHIWVSINHSHLLNIIHIPKPDNSLLGVRVDDVHWVLCIVSYYHDFEH